MHISVEDCKITKAFLKSIHKKDFNKITGCISQEQKINTIIDTLKELAIWGSITFDYGAQNQLLLRIADQESETLDICQAALDTPDTGYLLNNLKQHKQMQAFLVSEEYNSPDELCIKRSVQQLVEIIISGAANQGEDEKSLEKNVWDALNILSVIEDSSQKKVATK